MSMILYYSNYCQSSKNVINEIVSSNMQKEMHFLCVDNRQQLNGRIYILLKNGQRILMPKEVIRTPSLFLITKNQIIVGENISQFLKPKRTYKKMVSTKNNGEPMCFSTYEMGTSLSDSYSYLDQNSDEMSAKGDGGLRQMHNFVKLTQNDSIETPPEDYEPDKVGEVDMGKLQAQRDADIAQATPSNSF